MLRPEVRRRRIWLHDCLLCRVLYFAFIVGRGNPCVKKAATQTMFGCKKSSVYRLDACMFAIIEKEAFPHIVAPSAPSRGISGAGRCVCVCLLWLCAW